MNNARPALEELFERPITYPDVDAQDRFARLVGLDDHKARLTKILGLLINPAGIEAWAKKHHPKANKLINVVLRRPSLVVLAGDVGSGKTELAETVGDAVARQEKIEMTLFPLSLSTRGQGRVGEMTQLLSAAFDHTIAEATKLRSTSASARGADDDSSVGLSADAGVLPAPGAASGGPARAGLLCAGTPAGLLVCGAGVRFQLIGRARREMSGQAPKRPPSRVPGLLSACRRPPVCRQPRRQAIVSSLVGFG